MLWDLRISFSLLCDEHNSYAPLLHVKRGRLANLYLHKLLSIKRASVRNTSRLMKIRDGVKLYVSF